MYHKGILQSYKEQKLREMIAYLQSELDDRMLMKSRPCQQANLTREIDRLKRELGAGAKCNTLQ